MSKLDQLKREMGANVAESTMRREGGAVSLTPLPGLSNPRTDGVTRSKSAMEVPVAKIDRDPGQPREEFDPEALARLAESLKARGQLQPVRLRWDEPAGRYRLIAGKRRWRAARMAGLATLKAIIHDGPITPSELLTDQVVENALREDLKPIEQAREY